MNIIRLTHSLRNPMINKGGFDVKKGIELLKKANIILIDVDSTIIRKEGIDILAKYLHKENELLPLKSK